MTPNTVTPDASTDAVTLPEVTDTAEPRAPKAKGRRATTPQSKSQAKAVPSAEVKKAKKVRQAQGPQAAEPATESGTTASEVPLESAAPAEAVHTPAPTPPKARGQAQAKARAKPRSKAKAPPPTPTPAEQVQQEAPTKAALMLDEAHLWDQDDPVKSRLAQLRARNALLEEQLQRLKPLFQARGKRP